MNAARGGAGRSSSCTSLDGCELHGPGRLTSCVENADGDFVSLQARRDDEAAGAILVCDVRDAGVCETCGGLEEVGHREVWLRWEGGVYDVG